MCLLEQLVEERGHANAGALQLLIDNRRRARIVGLRQIKAVLVFAHACGKMGDRMMKKRREEK